jgi:cobalt-zinc-cadmium resistance protein CzcA
VGFISLFGVAVMEGVILLTYYHQLQREGAPRVAAVEQAAEVRMRPVLMSWLPAAHAVAPPAHVMASNGVLTALPSPSRTDRPER